MSDIIGNEASLLVRRCTSLITAHYAEIIRAIRRISNSRLLSWGYEQGWVFKNLRAVDVILLNVKKSAHALPVICCHPTNGGLQRLIDK